MVKFALAFVFYFVLFSTTNADCTYSYGPWNACINGIQNRSVLCVCDEIPDQDLTLCLQANVPSSPTVQQCEMSCRWVWTKWSVCTAACAGGNTTRSQVCVCEGEFDPVNEEFCEEEHYGDEVADCNNFDCDDMPARNKLYWMESYRKNGWPMKNEEFNCSLGYEKNSTSPKGRRYSDILLDRNPQNEDHPEWFYVAKEWIATKLNIAAGVVFPKEILDIVEKLAVYLEKCDGWSEKDMYFIYAAKEKLSRINNNIGGLDHVEDQVSFIIDGQSEEEEEEERANAFILAIGIPMVFILLVGVIVGISIHYLRERRKSVIVEKFESDDENSLENSPKNENPIFGEKNEIPLVTDAAPIPLDPPGPFGENPAEKVGDVPLEGQRFNEGDSSEED